MQTHYQRIGGEAAVRALVERFYEHMDTLPQAQDIRRMHPADLAPARQKLYEFLTGWMGGPPLYVNKYGQPRLRQRHLPFPIDDAARDQWMLCMRRALDEVVTDPALRQELAAAFQKVADHMRNR